MEKNLVTSYNIHLIYFLFNYFTVLLCGLVGFSDFYKLDWLQSILTWQDQEVGCFGKEGELL